MQTLEVFGFGQLRMEYCSKTVNAFPTRHVEELLGLPYDSLAEKTFFCGIFDGHRGALFLREALGPRRIGAITWISRIGSKPNCL